MNKNQIERYKAAIDMMIAATEMIQFLGCQVDPITLKRHETNLLIREELYKTSPDLNKVRSMMLNAMSPSKKEETLHTIARNAEMEKIMEVLKDVRWNKTKAAAILGVDRKTLYNKLKAYDELQKS